MVSDRSFSRGKWYVSCTFERGIRSSALKGSHHLQDVLCGRGGKSNHHPGNEWYRNLIKSRRPLYRASAKHSKLVVATSIVHAVEQQNGRFLERDEHTGFWYPVPHKRAVNKTSQGLRENDRDDPDDSRDDGETDADTEMNEMAIHDNEAWPNPALVNQPPPQTSSRKRKASKVYEMQSEFEASASPTFLQRATSSEWFHYLNCLVSDDLTPSESQTFLQSLFWDVLTPSVSPSPAQPAVGSCKESPISLLDNDEDSLSPSPAQPAVGTFKKSSNSLLDDYEDSPMEARLRQVQRA